jgi:hypothetical protein
LGEKLLVTHLPVHSLGRGCHDHTDQGDDKVGDRETHDLPEDRAVGSGRVALKIGGVGSKRRATGGCEEEETDDGPSPLGALQNRRLVEGVTDSTGLLEGDGEKADSRDDKGGELDVDQDPPLGTEEVEDPVRRLECFEPNCTRVKHTWTTDKPAR